MLLCATGYYKTEIAMNIMLSIIARKSVPGRAAMIGNPRSSFISAADHNPNQHTARIRRIMVL
jgi:hypothetical protein